MVALREIRECLLFFYESNIISEEEFTLVYIEKSRDFFLKLRIAWFRENE